MPLPPQSRIEVVEDSRERLLFQIPGGGGETRIFGVVATVTIVFLGLLTPVWLRSGEGFRFGLFAFLLIFWSVAIGMAVFALKLAYTRTLVLIEPERAAVRKQFFRWTTTKEVLLGRNASARLDVAYTSNNQPVHRVLIESDDQNATFGTTLSVGEKDWLVERINEFVGHEPAAASIEGRTSRFASQCIACAANLPPEGNEPRVCPVCGAEQPELITLLTGEVSPAVAVPEIDPSQFDRADLPAIVIDSQPPDALQFHLPIVPWPRVRLIARGIVLVVLVIVFGGSLTGVAAMLMKPRDVDWIAALFFLVGAIAVLLPFSVPLILLFGRTTVRIDEQAMRIRWFLAPFGKRKVVPIQDITRVNLLPWSPSASRRQTSADSSIAPTPPHPTMLWSCTITARGEHLIVLVLYPRDVTEHVAAMVQRQPREVGAPLET